MLPCKNCKVKTADGRFGLVVKTKPESEGKNIQINFRTEVKWLELAELNHAFSEGDYVLHCPPAGNDPELGLGVITSQRTVLGYNQLLVQFVDSGEKRWLDWRVLAHTKSTEHRMAKGEAGCFPNHAKRVRLRMLSKGLQIWDANTGAFGRLDIDPLPHQLDVANKVVSAEKARWLLADDVGLGKTIEVGLIIHALSQRNRCRRVLIVCPSSLTRQWKEEMRYKFARFFEIYHRDFRPEFPNEMKQRDNVIISLDLGKRDEHLNFLLQAGDWDMIIFDEAHRLGRSETGEQTERYKLAKALRDKSPSFLLLTATPHQGKSKRFRALLELVRPDMIRLIQGIDFNPDIIRSLIIRNKKSRVTDAEGNFIFKGHDTHRVPAERGKELRQADIALRHYLKNGYRASTTSKDKKLGRAIGFVMTTYRKLASSSIAAIETALAKRLSKLREAAMFVPLDISEDDFEDNDAPEELLVSTPQFFEDEINELEDLLGVIKEARSFDTKLNKFLTEILQPLLEQGHSVLIFTEYRATQSYLAEEIQRVFFDITKISFINGSMKIDQRLDDIQAFNDGLSQIMISTEAGGEGLNLQEACHVMVNYDLPWNPARLVQRIGRLYRYGQKKRVQVFNLQSDDGFDNQALDLMMIRVTTMANELAALTDDTQEQLSSEILGELLSQINMTEILEKSTTLDIKRTEQEIEDAIKAAQEARDIEDDILKFSNSYTSKLQGGFMDLHMVSFVEGMSEHLGIKVRQKLHSGRTLDLELPEHLVGRWPEFRKKNIVRLSVDKSRHRARDDVVPMDFECSFVSDLSAEADNRWEFDGVFGLTNSFSTPDLVVLFNIFWQGIAGEFIEQELVPFAASGDQWTRMEHDHFADLLLQNWQSVSDNNSNVQKEMIHKLKMSFEESLMKERSESRTPMFSYIVCGVRSV